MPIFKLTLPYFLLYKWPGVLSFFFGRSLQISAIFIAFIELVCCERHGNKGSCRFVSHGVHLHSVHGESWWMTVGFVLTITRERCERTREGDFKKSVSPGL